VQIAAASTHENREHNLRHAKTWSIIAWLLALLFVFMGFAQADSVSRYTSPY
jgi:heme/copper-type cytochrome/quinol oxidase subunit 3